MNRKIFAAAALLVFAPALAAAQGTVAIEGGTVHTMTGAAIEGGTVLIRDGRIVAVGQNVSVPAGARRIDARGKQVTPGFIESGTQIGAVEVGAVAGSVDHTLITPPDEVRMQIRAGFNIADGINPNSTVIPVTRIGGITTAVSRPSGGLISGQGVVLDLDGRTTREMLVRSPVAMFARVGEGAAQVTGGTRGAATMRLREVLEDARAYARGRANFERGASREYAASRLDLDALQGVLNRQMPMVIEAHRASDILTAIELARDYNLRLIIAGATEAWMVADDLARERVPVVVRVLENLPGNFERLGARYENAALLRQAGVQVILTSGDTHNARNLRQEAGNAVAYGMPRDEALRSVTLYPAQLWGLQDYGSLAAGKVANVVVWDGDPLEIMTPVSNVFIRGREIPLVSRQTQLRDRYLELNEQTRAFPRAIP
ncbi:MAG: amidohydrolase family protein [Gemmatimonadetes bacterium]|nr:amidohydrolase family protein [Gemmatimonadota bacterium]